MRFVISISLTPSPDQFGRLLALQAAFALVCNDVAHMVQKTRTWNRVALHHLLYRDLRKRYPAIGSQMICNSIYSVSSVCHLVFQNVQSPLHVHSASDEPLPLLKFLNNCPVYFDRHTLALKNGRLSLFTLDGRMRFDLALTDSAEECFKERKLLQTMLLRNSSDKFELAFMFESQVDEQSLGSTVSDKTLIPDFVKVEAPCEC